MSHLATVARGTAVTTAAVSLGWAAVGDVRFYRIPNILPALIATAFVLMACFTSRAVVAGGLLTGVAVFAVCAILFAWGRMGGGDVKLMAATALWAGPSLLLPFALVMSLTGGALALLLLSPLRRAMPPPPPRLTSTSGASSGSTGAPMPFGVAIAAGGLWVLSRWASLR